MAIKYRNYTAAIKRVIGSGQNVGLAPHQVVIGNAGGGLGQVSGLGTAGQVLTSAGPGADPSFAAPAGGPADKEVWLSGLSLPTAFGYTVQAETFPRILASTTNALNSGIARFTAINLPAGLTLTQMTMIVGTLSESGGTHGWYALLDLTGKVVAVTADQTGATFWSPINTPISLLFTASYKTTYRGVFYAMVSVNASSLPNIVGNPPSSGAASAAPVLGGLCGSSPSTPPALGTTLALTAGSVGLYAAVG